MAVTYEKLWEFLKEKNMKKTKCSDKPESVEIFLPEWVKINLFQWKVLKKYVVY